MKKERKSPEMDGNHPLQYVTMGPNIDDQEKQCWPSCVQLQSGAGQSGAGHACSGCEDDHPMDALNVVTNTIRWHIQLPSI